MTCPPMGHYNKVELDEIMAQIIKLIVYIELTYGVKLKHVHS